jgi:predicted phage terminase large subunit-like protein
MTVFEQEPGSGGKESAEFTVRQLAGFRVRADKVTGAKEIRAQPFADQCEAGNVRVVKALWNMRFIEELSVFPAGDYDDQVDAASGAFAWSLRVPVYEAPTSMATGFNPDRHGFPFDDGRDWRSLFPRR